MPDFEALIADEALLDGDFGATNRDSARRALSRSSRQFHFAAALESQHTCTHSAVQPVVECLGVDLADC